MSFTTGRIGMSIVLGGILEPTYVLGERVSAGLGHSRYHRLRLRPLQMFAGCDQ